MFFEDSQSQSQQKGRTLWDFKKPKCAQGLPVIHSKISVYPWIQVYLKVPLGFVKRAFSNCQKTKGVMIESKKKTLHSNNDIHVGRKTTKLAEFEPQVLPAKSTYI